MKDAKNPDKNTSNIPLIIVLLLEELIRTTNQENEPTNPCVKLSTKALCKFLSVSSKTESPSKAIIQIEKVEVATSIILI